MRKRRSGSVMGAKSSARGYRTFKEILEEIQDFTLIKMFYC